MDSVVTQDFLAILAFQVFLAILAFQVFLAIQATDNQVFPVILATDSPEPELAKRDPPAKENPWIRMKFPT